MLYPKKAKYRRSQKSRIKGMATNGNTVEFGRFGIKAVEARWLTSRQIEAARIAINRYMKREGKLYIRVFPDKPISEKPAEVRMGKGKGTPEYHVFSCKPGKVIFEIDGVREDVAREAMRLGAQKLPVVTRFVTRRDHIPEESQ
jgi:large subunit ribosomal protein L16